MRLPLALCTLLVTLASGAQENTDSSSEPLSSAYRLSGTEENARLSYQGDATRFGIGVDDDGHVYGEFFYLFNENPEAAWLGEGWVSRGAGGLKLNYHWLHGGSLDEAMENPTSARVNKAFLAVDQNEFDDRKATLGLGYEKRSHFLAAYLSREFTGRRFVGQSVATVFDQISGTQDGRPFVQDRTIETITRLYEHPYEYGVGVRLGRFFDEGLFRVRGGLDYEDGKLGSDQLTFTVGMEKFFDNSGHSLALNLEYFSRSGQFVEDESEGRALLMYRYHFGKRSNYGQRITHRESQQVREIPAVPPSDEVTVVSNRITVSEMAFFEFDSASIRNDASNTLAALADRIKSLKLISEIDVTGHTCDLGSDAYNQTLSEQRAEAARSYLQSQGLTQVGINAAGAGESQPRFSNSEESTRQKNRRVEIEFLTLETEEQTEVTPGVPASQEIEWVKEPVTDPAWIKRALRNPILHKRTVDTYRIEEATATETLGPIQFINQDPGAVDDTVSVPRNSQSFAIDVLANDTDGDGDTLTIVSISEPANGSAQTDGGLVTYTPVEDFTGTDSFQYTVEDGNGGQATATVNISVVNSPPTAGADEATVSRGQAVSIAVLDNDEDADGSQLTLVSVSSPTFGSASISGDSVVYTADTEQLGVATMMYTVRDSDGATATAQINVTVRNSPPTAIADSASVARGGTVDIEVLANDSDADGTELTVRSITSPMNGSAFIRDKAVVVYSPAAGFGGTEMFSYEVVDQDGDVATATITVTVANGVPIAVNDSAQTVKDTAVVIDVLANDSDPDGDTLTVVAVAPQLTGFGTVEIQSDNTILYTPNPGWWGGDEFTYTISDGFGGEASAQVTLTITEFE